MPLSPNISMSISISHTHRHTQQLLRKINLYTHSLHLSMQQTTCHDSMLHTPTIGRLLRQNPGTDSSSDFQRVLLSTFHSRHPPQFKVQVSLHHHNHRRHTLSHTIPLNALTIVLSIASTISLVFWVVQIRMLSLAGILIM